MLVFSTRLPIKEEISQEMCLQLFIEWITTSEHYPINEIDYDVNSHSDFEYTKDHIRFSIRCYKDDEVEISACRFENNTEDAVWCNDGIILCEGGKKTLLIQLNCNRLNYTKKLPPVYKPAIVRKFIENGYCRSDANIPVVDRPLNADSLYFGICVEIMRGKYSNLMPVVYLSCNHRGRKVVSGEYLARQLGGVAHVFEEKDHYTGLKLSEVTKGNAVHSGCIGIYYPGASQCQKFEIGNYNDYRHMSHEIINSVWTALIERLDSSVYNWSHVIALQSRQNMLKWQGNSTGDTQQVTEYDTYDDGLPNVTKSNGPSAKKMLKNVGERSVYPRDHAIAREALYMANFKCEINSEHPTFIRKKQNVPYMESHHLIPLAYAERFDVSLDVVENIVSLCSNCHNEIHYGRNNGELIRFLYEKRKSLLEQVGISISLEELLWMYNG